MGDGVPDAVRERAPARVVGCFIGAVDALSGPAAVGAVFSLAIDVVGGGGAGAWCEGAGVGVMVGSSLSSAPVMDSKPVSLAVMVMRCRRPGPCLVACCVVACCVQCAPLVLCSWAVRSMPAHASNPIRRQRGAQSLDDDAAAAEI